MTPRKNFTIRGPSLFKRELLGDGYVSVQLTAYWPTAIKIAYRQLRRGKGMLSQVGLQLAYRKVQNIFAQHGG